MWLVDGTQIAQGAFLSKRGTQPQGLGGGVLVTLGGDNAGQLVEGLQIGSLAQGLQCQALTFTKRWLFLEKEKELPSCHRVA